MVSTGRPRHSSGSCRAAISASSWSSSPRTRRAGLEGRGGDVALASLQLVLRPLATALVANSTNRRSEMRDDRGLPFRWRARAAAVGSVKDLRRSRHPKPYPKAALAGPQWNREARPLKRHSWLHQRIVRLARKRSSASDWSTCRRPAHVNSSSSPFASFRSAVLKPSVNQP